MQTHRRAVCQRRRPADWRRARRSAAGWTKRVQAQCHLGGPPWPTAAALARLCTCWSCPRRRHTEHIQIGIEKALSLAAAKTCASTDNPDSDSLSLARASTAAHAFAPLSRSTQMRREMDAADTLGRRKSFSSGTYEPRGIRGAIWRSQLFLVANTIFWLDNLWELLFWNCIET